MSKRKIIKSYDDEEEKEKERVILPYDMWYIVTSFFEKTDISTLLNFLVVCKINYIFIKDILIDLHIIYKCFRFCPLKGNLTIVEITYPKEKDKYEKDPSILTISKLDGKTKNILNKNAFLLNTRFKQSDIENIKIFIKFIYKKLKYVNMDKLVKKIDLLLDYDNNKKDLFDLIYVNSILLTILNLSIKHNNYLRRKDNKNRKIKLQHPCGSSFLRNIYYYSNKKDKIIPLYELKKIKIIKQEDDVIIKSPLSSSSSSNIEELNKRETNQKKRELLKIKYDNYIKENFSKSRQEIYENALINAKPSTKLAIIYNTLMKELILIKPTKKHIFENVVVKSSKNNYVYINSKQLSSFRENCFIFNMNIKDAYLFYKLILNKKNHIIKINNLLEICINIIEENTINNDNNNIK